MKINVVMGAALVLVLIASAAATSLTVINDRVIIDNRPSDDPCGGNGSGSISAGGRGYMLLTNFLPNSAGSGPLGNGTYKLHVIITNKSGHEGLPVLI